MAHEATHEELLQRMLAGDLQADESRSRALLEGCTECAQRWSELSETVAVIEALDRERREVLAEAALGHAAPGSDRVATTLARERLRTFGDPRRARGAPVWRRVLLAAALLVGGIFVVRALMPPEPDVPDVILGSEAIRFIGEPRTIGPGRSIRWQHASGSDKGPFAVHLSGELAGGQPFSRVVRVRGAEWAPDDDLVRQLPDPVLVRVVAVDASGHENPLESSSEIRVSVSR